MRKRALPGEKSSAGEGNTAGAREHSEKGALVLGRGALLGNIVREELLQKMTCILYG